MKTWQRWFIVLLIAAAVIAIAAWLVQGRRAATLAQGAASAPAAARQASGPAVQRLEVLALDVLRIERAEFTRGIEISGSIKAVNTAFVKARVAAELRDLTVREGDTVRAGQVLGHLDATEFIWRLRQAEQQAAAAQAQLEIAQRQMVNNKALVAQGFISPTALESAVSSEAGAKATLQAALAAVELARKAQSDTTITAPISGQVSQRLAQPGERVAVDARLLEIVDLSRLELEAAVAPGELEALRVGQLASLSLEGSGNADPRAKTGSGAEAGLQARSGTEAGLQARSGTEAGLQARVARINPSAQAGSRSVSAYLALQPHPLLRQGLFARGRIELERRSGVLMPLSAVRDDLAQPYAIRLHAGRSERATLTLGGRGQSGGVEVVEVLQGLSAGDQILAASVGLVPPGVVVNVARMPAVAPAASPASTR